MKPLSNIWSRLRSWCQQRVVKREIDEELRFHIEQRTAENLAAGMPPEEAAREARKKFGNVQGVREECRNRRGANLGETVWQDVRFGLRMLRKSPGFTTIAVLSLALGIGANTAIFSLLNAVLLRSLPVRNPHELRTIQWKGTDLKANMFSGQQEANAPDGLTISGSFAYPTYREFRDQAARFSDISAFSRLWKLSVLNDDQAFIACGLMVSGNFFKMLGINAVAGRTLTPEDDQPGTSPVAVISYSCWQRYFSSNPNVIGKAVTVNRLSFTIVGVLPETFRGVHAGTTWDVYLPMSAQPQLMQFYPLDSKDCWWVEMVGRLRSVGEERQALAELNVLFNQSVSDASGRQWLQHPGIILEDGSRGPLVQRRYYAKSLPLLLAAVSLVLLVACANLASLLLSRAAARQHEMAVRAAVGAGRWRLLRQSMTESLLIAAGGAGLGMVVARWGRELLPRLLWPETEPLSFDLKTDAHVFAFTVGVAFVAALLFGILPAWRSSQVDTVSRLKDRAGMGTPRLRLGKVLVTAQVGLSLLLLAGAGLFLRTLVNLTHIEPGFNPEHLLVFRLDPIGYQNQRLLNFYQDINSALRSIPGVRSVALSDTLLLSGGMSAGGGLSTPDRPAGAGQNLHSIRCTVDESFFSTMEIPLQQGRAFTTADNETSAKVIVVNETLARSFFPGENPVGRIIRMKGAIQIDTEIVGVCRDVKFDSLKNAAEPTIFFPGRQFSDQPLTHVLVRTALPPLSLVPAVRKAVASVDPKIPMDEISTQKLTLNRSIAQERLFASLCGALAALAVLLSGIGLYGLMAYNVARRTGEIGIRMALGATRGRIAWPILRETLLLAGMGVLMGEAGALALTRFIRSRLYEVTPNDPIIFAAAGLMLLAAAAVAAWLPARRAAKIDPLEALRCE